MGLYTVLIKGSKMWRRGLDKGEELGTSRVGMSYGRVSRKCVINVSFSKVYYAAKSCL